jgi:[ribosomal protein S5]-alanine N-acetyltransferase
MGIRMLREDPVVLRQLSLNDADVLAHLANNKKVWDNLRDFFPFPYAKEHAIEFIKMVSQEAPYIDICH